MFFMHIDLAVIWINKALQIVDVQHARRWRPVYRSSNPARFVLELSLEKLDSYMIGDQLSFE